MKPTEKELKILRFYAKYTHTEDKYVWLRKDDKGTYVEYAFKDGAPHDNRCISWYHSFQPNALKRNGWDDERIQARKKAIDEKVGGLYELQSFTCGWEKYPESSLKRAKESWEKYNEGEPFVPEEYTCKVGCPAPKCVKNKTCGHWTYDEPVKCACWELWDATIPNKVSIPIDLAMDLSNFLIKE